MFFLILLCGIYCFAGSGKQVAPDTPFLQVENARFYSALSVDIDNDGRMEIIAVGQQGSGDDHSGFIALYYEKDNKLEPLTSEVFKITHQGKKIPTRIRSIVVLPHTNPDLREIYTAGRGGADEKGVGFLRQAVFNSKDKSFKEVTTHIFQQKDSSYTHGYPLNPIQFTQDSAGAAVVYGGFSSNPRGSGDIADVRIFKRDAAGKSSETTPRPFAGLSIPLRVNAMAVADLDKDGREDVLIAGRTVVRKKDQAAFAIRLKDKTLHKIFSDELPGRLRTLLIADIDKDGEIEIISGGRTGAGETTFGRLDLSYLQGDSLQRLSRYCWTGEGATRIRALAPYPKDSAFFAVGRSQVRAPGKNKPAWAGYIGKFRIREGRIVPCAEPRYFRLSKETRFRSAICAGADRLLISGFTLDKEKISAAIILVAPVK
jgi:hypothetical protein